MTIKDNTDGVLSEVDRLIKQKLEHAALLVERTAKRPGYCPVKTGTARRSIMHVMDVNGKVVYIGSNIEYFPYIELGTSKMAARSPLRRALHTNKGAIRRTFGGR